MVTSLSLSLGSLLGAASLPSSEDCLVKNTHTKTTTTPHYSLARRISELWSATGGKISMTPLNGRTEFSTLFVLLTLLFPPSLWFVFPLPRTRIQLIRIELRVPEYGWTTQKVFHLMNFIVNGVRAVVFGFHKQVFIMHPKGCCFGEWEQALVLLLLDLPGLLFFSTFTLLVLFWAEIYHQASFIFELLSNYFRVYARSLPSDKLRVFYISVNAAMYFIQVCIWVYLWIDDNSVVELIGKIFIAVLSILAALSFLVYGGRLFFMLKRFPIESKGRRKKLHEYDALHCRLDQLQPYASLASLSDVLCLQVLLSAFDADASLDVLDHPVLNFIYYMLVEILPSALVLYILRKLPPKRISAQYHPIC
ncbi:hypothetical protein POTOM_040337 [Populus tomentosa]|uniref:THH1/TOM1/TOM3 domain-containing protein n=2 Tax=Populus TaxID=3689 RepID=A0A8X8CHI9_POPTO|nr:hypothetical protein POTOM_040337 [Populus tomentosa]